jgi:hypothetical protein
LSPMLGIEPKALNMADKFSLSVHLLMDTRVTDYLG